MDNFMLILAYDGDNAGRLVGRSILANDTEALSEVSNRINLGHEIVSNWVAEHGGSVISGGGDEGTFQIPQEALVNIEELRADYQFATNLTMTVGVGKSLSEAGKSLLVGKFRGKNMVVQYDPGIESEIQQAQERISQGTGSEEERKLGEAYLKPDGGNAAVINKENADAEQKSNAAPSEDPCPYCKDGSVTNEDSSLSDCPYCAEAAGELEEADCPYCREMDEEADCPYCAEAEAKEGTEGAPEEGSSDLQQSAAPNTKLPTTTSSQDYAGQNLDAPAMDKPDPSKEPPIGLGTSMDSPTNSNEKLDGQGAVNEKIPKESIQADYSKEALQAIASEIESEDGPVPSDKATAENVDSTDQAVGNEMEGNVSRQAGFEENAPSDMAVGSGPNEDGEPEYSDVLQEGLDQGADDIQRERVIEIAFQALQGFKGCRDILEQSKAQSPQLYSSSIALLRAMIEMAKLLGLDEGMNEENPLGEAGQDDEWSDPFPKHPDHGGEPKPGHAPSANNPPAGAAPAAEGGSIGQPLGKLPTSATTEHVARTPLLPGATNTQGQKKVIDPVTGKTRWIDMKEGRVQSPTGVPIKPPKQGNNEPKA